MQVSFIKQYLFLVNRFVEILLGVKIRIPYFCCPLGGLAQLARAFAWHAKGHRFDSGNLHKKA